MDAGEMEAGQRQRAAVHRRARTARFWHLRADGQVQCDLCPRACRLGEGQRGACFVRARQGDRMVLTTDGRASGCCVDPIEKKPLHHVLPGTAVLSFGTAGCNLACEGCQNWELTTARSTDRLGQLASPEQLLTTARRLGCRSVAFTYNDPIVFHEYALDVAAACRAGGLLAVAVTAGYVQPTPRAEFFAGMDAANVDLKAITDDVYRRTCGGRLAPVLDTLRYVARETDVWLEVSTLVVPGVNDSDEHLDTLTAWVASELGLGVPLHLTAFHPAHRLRHVPPTPPATLRRARRLAQANGLRHVYLGNVHDPSAGTTRCTGCGAAVLVRDGYQVVRAALDDHGRCQGCATQVPGRFDGPVGRWGRRCLPVRVAG
jgi:pyruvate formate lyase activating enzyme